MTKESKLWDSMFLCKDWAPAIFSSSKGLSDMMVTRRFERRAFLDLVKQGSIRLHLGSSMLGKRFRIDVNYLLYITDLSTVKNGFYFLLWNIMLVLTVISARGIQVSLAGLNSLYVFWRLELIWLIHILSLRNRHDQAFLGGFVFIEVWHVISNRSHFFNNSLSPI